MRLPLVPQLFGVPPQLPVTETVKSCAVAGMDANAASTKTMVATLRDAREGRLLHPFSGGGSTNS